MAPSGRTSTTTTNKTSRTTKTTTGRRTRTRQPRRTCSKRNKKQEVINKVLPSSCVRKSSEESSKEEREENNEVSEVIDVSVSNSACSTPKGQKFRIPEVSTCPPAPKKQRVVSNCSLRRSPLSFFVPPDLDNFFLVTLPDVSV